MGGSYLWCCRIFRIGLTIQKIQKTHAGLIFNITACCLPCAWCWKVSSGFTASSNHHRWMLRPKWIFLNCRLFHWLLHVGWIKSKLYYKHKRSESHLFSTNKVKKNKSKSLVLINFNWFKFGRFGLGDCAVSGVSVCWQNAKSINSLCNMGNIDPFYQCVCAKPHKWLYVCGFHT